MCFGGSVCYMYEYSQYFSFFSLVSMAMAETVENQCSDLALDRIPADLLIHPQPYLPEARERCRLDQSYRAL